MTLHRETAANPSADPERFLRSVQALVSDLYAADPRRYYRDFLIAIAIAYAALYVYLASERFSIVQVVAFAVCGFALYHAVVFTHELVHQRGRWLARFSIVWNVLCGIPWLVPSFLYGDHRGHHAKGRYGTARDPEYVRHGSQSALRFAGAFALPLIYPVFPLIRFLLLTPIALASRAADRIIWRYASSLYNMNEAYQREDDAAAFERGRWWQEIACCVWAWTLVALVIDGRMPWPVVVKLYLVYVLWTGINQVRTLATHRYTNHAGAPISHVDQLLDTYTFDRGVCIPYLWAPVGLRYHALHHLMPSMPYHALRAAHGRLMRGLPAGSPYHRTCARSMVDALRGTLDARSSSVAGGLQK